MNKRHTRETQRKKISFHVVEFEVSASAMNNTFSVVFLVLVYQEDHFFFFLSKKPKLTFILSHSILK